MDLIHDPWPWYTGGPLIALTMITLLLIGRRFGVSSNFETLCTIAGAGRLSDYFKVDWKKNAWNLVFVAGSITGGFIASQYMGPNGVTVSEATAASLPIGTFEQGIDFIPQHIFSWENLFTAQGLIMIVLGGFLVGFGTRYAGGCTSGHAISGLSNLQLPSLIAVMGFFVGGLIVTWIFMPHLLTL